MIPFAVTIADDERDRDFAGKLKHEWPGVLQLMIDGCLEWRKSGLAAPVAVEQATDAYFAGEDGYSDWIADRCETSGGFADAVDQIVRLMARLGGQGRPAGRRQQAVS